MIARPRLSAALLSLAGIAALAGCGAALGWLGAILSVAIHLRRIG